MDMHPLGRPTYIYGLREPDTQLIRYIGKTTNPHRRWLNHLCEKSHCKRTYWIRKLARTGLQPEMVIISEIRGEPWQAWERFWIAFGIKNGWPLVNMTSGGDGVPDSATKPRRYLGDEHWTRKKPERVARGGNNGARRHPELILRGSKSPASRLTEEQVKQIRRMANDGYAHIEIAGRFSTSRRNVWYIVNRKQWKHVE